MYVKGNTALSASNRVIFPPTSQSVSSNLSPTPLLADNALIIHHINERKRDYLMKKHACFSEACLNRHPGDLNTSN